MENIFSTPTENVSLRHILPLALFTMIACILLVGITSAEDTNADGANTTCTVEFLLDDGTQYIPDVTVEYNSKVSRPSTNPSVLGKTFNGWYNGENYYNFNNRVTSDLTLTAKFSVKQYSVKYVDTDRTTVLGIVGCTYDKIGTYEPIVNDYIVTSWLYNNEPLSKTEEFPSSLTLVADSKTLYFASGYEFTVGKFNYSINSDLSTVTLIGANEYRFGSIDWVINYHGTDMPLTAIGNNAFEGKYVNCGDLILPSTLNKIGDYAFKNARMYGVTFNYNPNLTIGKQAFYGCECMYFRFVPGNINAGTDAFYGCECDSLTFYGSNTTIGAKAFYGCKCESITFKHNVNELCKEAFSGCTELKSITFEETVNKIGAKAFYGCTALTAITIPSSVTSVGSKAFGNCTSLATITIESGATGISYNAFGYIFYKVDTVQIIMGWFKFSVPVYTFISQSGSNFAGHTYVLTGGMMKQVA